MSQRTVVLEPKEGTAAFPVYSNICLQHCMSLDREASLFFRGTLIFLGHMGLFWTLLFELRLHVVCSAEAGYHLLYPRLSDDKSGRSSQEQLAHLILPKQKNPDTADCPKHAHPCLSWLHSNSIPYKNFVVSLGWLASGYMFWDFNLFSHELCVVNCNWGMLFEFTLYRFTLTALNLQVMNYGQITFDGLMPEPPFTCKNHKPD